MVRLVPGAARTSLGGIEAWFVGLVGLRCFRYSDGIFDDGVIAFWKRMTTVIAVERWEEAAVQQTKHHMVTRNRAPT